MPDKVEAASATLSTRAFAMPKVSIHSVVLFGVLGLALLLRLTGIEAGLPLVLNDDEPWIVEHSAALSWHDLSPHIYMYGSLPFFLFKAGMVLASPLQAAITGHPATLPDQYLLSRLISAAFGTGTVYLAYVLGNLIAGRRVGLFSAGLFALSPLAINLSHYATVDSMMGFWSALALTGVALRLAGNKRGLFLAGAAVGLAVATKYNAAVLLIPLALCAIQLLIADGTGSKPPSRLQRNSVLGIVAAGWIILVVVLANTLQILNLAAKWTNTGTLQSDYVSLFDKLLMLYAGLLVIGLLLAIGLLSGGKWANVVVSVGTSKPLLYPCLVSFAVFIVAFPFVVLDFPNFARDFFFQVRKNQSGGAAWFAADSRSYQVLAGQPEQHNPLQYLLAIQAEWGWLVFAAMIVGVWALWRRNRQAWIAFVPLLAIMLLLTAGWNYLATRYLYPVWPLLTLLGALGIAYAAEKVARMLKVNKMVQTAAAVALAGAFLMGPFFFSLGEARSFLLTDTRNQALTWLEQNVPAGTSIVREWGTPDIERATNAYNIRLVESPFVEATLAQWRTKGVNIIMISNERLLFYKEHAADFEDVLAEYSKLSQEGTLRSSFLPNQNVKGPEIYIYGIN